MSLRLADGGFVVTGDRGEEILLRCFDNGELKSDHDFTVKALVTPHVRETEWRLLRNAKEPKEPLGMVLPALAFDSDSALSEENKHIQSFAVNAVYHFFSKKTAREELFKLAGREKEATISRLFGETFAILILDVSQLQKFDIKDADFLTGLFIDGWHSWESMRQIATSAKYAKNCPVAAISKDLVGYEGIIVDTLNAANRADSAASCFLLLYQIFELLIARVFDHEINKLLASAQNMDPWKLREGVQEISQERGRIESIKNEYTPAGLIDRVGSACIESCNLFLTECGSADKVSDSFSKSLYSVRNEITHRRYYAINYDSKLDEVCQEFRCVLKSVITEFQLQ